MSGVDEMELDAYRACPGGVYRTPTVTVRCRPLVDRRRLGIARTAHFDIGRVGTGLLLEHNLAPEEVSDDISGYLSEELFDAGWIRGPELFEELLVGIVLTSLVAGWLSDRVAPTKLVFEADASGVVSEWRVGLLPEVDYVEGCS